MTVSPDFSPADAPEPARLSYEQALQALEALVADMEAGRMPLDDLLAAYRRGSALLAECRARLDAVEQQVQVLADGALRDAPGLVATLDDGGRG